MELLFSQKSYRNYTKDSLFNTQNKWYWKWEKQNIKNLYTKCSKCDEILLYDENSNNNIVYFFCPSCNSQEMNIKGGNYNHSIFMLQREIKRKACVGKYKKVS